jgi:hypothetical protein
LANGRIPGAANHEPTAGAWVTVLALPLAALALLAAEPGLDRRWEHHPSHFWLVLTVAGVNVALGLVASEAASRRDDDRTFLVSMALLASAGFLGLHALARVPLPDRPLPPDALPPPLGLLALVGVVLYGIAAVRYAELYRRRRRPLPLAVLVAFILMAEAMIAVAFSRTWHAMWWEWHLLMAVAFGAILVAARVEYRREGSLGAVFAGIYLLAARLQSTAPPGEVVIGPTTREDLGDRATVIPLGEAQLKGKREPVPIYRLVSVDGEMTRG